MRKRRGKKPQRGLSGYRDVHTHFVGLHSGWSLMLATPLTSQPSDSFFYCSSFVVFLVGPMHWARFEIAMRKCEAVDAKANDMKKKNEY